MSYTKEKDELKEMLSLYIKGRDSSRYQVNERQEDELEIRFGTNTFLSRPITKIDYDNVVKQLYHLGFQPQDGNVKGNMMLRIQNEFTDSKSGYTKMSQLRTEINGIDLIQEYCKTNNIQKLIDNPANIYSSFSKIIYTLKTGVKHPKQDFIMRPVNFNDHSFRVSYQVEERLNNNANLVKETISKWTGQKKMFRYMNRTRFIHPDYPVYADISIIKSNRTTKNKITGKKIPVLQYTVQDAFLFDNPEMYEIEFEFEKSKVGNGTEYDTTNKLMEMIFKLVRIILGALQGTNYPISYVERKDILEEYWKTVHQKHDLKKQEYELPKRITNHDFIGPSSYTLQMENIAPLFEENPAIAISSVDTRINLINGPIKYDKTIPNIRLNYAVTDKADGERKLLYIHGNGKIYMIDTNMNVIFTGLKTPHEMLGYSLIDGEHIRKDDKNNSVEIYAAFDIYFIHKKSVREYAFMKNDNDTDDETGSIKPNEKDKPNEKGKPNEKENKYRLTLLQTFIRSLTPVNITTENSKKDNMPSTCNFILKTKEFYSTANSGNTTIFDACSILLSNIENHLFPYNTDGIIFTPCSTGVASSKIGVAGPLSKTTWELSFKWKPPEYNTIDFLVSVKKDKNGRDELFTIFQEGDSLAKTDNITQYKKLVLMCGFDEKVQKIRNNIYFI